LVSSFLSLGASLETGSRVESAESGSEPHGLVLQHLAAASVGIAALGASQSHAVGVYVPTASEVTV